MQNIESRGIERDIYRDRDRQRHMETETQADRDTGRQRQTTVFATYSHLLRAADIVHETYGPHNRSLFVVFGWYA